MAATVSADAARKAIAANPVWYHTIELAPGVVTPGHIDLRGVATRVLPDAMNGMRALDVGSFDGFWAFEMEKRGADVVAIDVEEIDDAEWPPHQRERLAREVASHGVELGRGFRLAAEALGSRVDRVSCNVYDLGPDVAGEFDLVFSGAILLHLRDPVRGLERIREVIRPRGELRLLEPFSLALTMLHPRAPAARFSPMETPFNWWVPNLAALDGWLRVARFERLRRLAVVRPTARPEMRQMCVGLAYRPAG